MRVIKNPKGTRGNLRPLSEAGDSTMYHGGVVKSSGPYDNKTEQDVAAVGEAFQRSINDGLAALENGSSEFAPDVEPVPGSSVELFDIFDVHTGEHVMIWRVATRERSKHAN